jgi:hypothetical protein
MVRALIAMANVTVMGFNPASSDTVDSEGAANEAVLNTVLKIRHFWHFKRKKEKEDFDSTLPRKCRKKTHCSFLEKKSILNIDELIQQSC